MVKHAVVIFFIICASVECRKLPPFIDVCHRNDPNLSQCLRSNIERLQPMMAKGIPQLHIPPFDPIIIDEFTFVDTDNFKYRAKNIRAYHVENFSIRYIDLDAERNRFNLTLLFPFVHLETHYFLKGDLMVFSFDAEGEHSSNYTNILASACIDTEKVTRKGKTYLTVSKTYTDIKIDSFELNFEGVFSDKRLNSEFNKFLNENIENLFETIKPVASKFTFYQMIKTISTVLNLYTHDELFPE